MKSDVVIILGGSPLQRDLIEAARKSYYVILLDGNANCAMRRIPHEFVHLDFSDANKVLQFAMDKNPKHIRPTVIKVMPRPCRPSGISAYLSLSVIPAKATIANAQPVPAPNP